MSSAKVSVANDEIRYYVNKLIYDSNRLHDIENAGFLPFKRYFVQRARDEVEKDRVLIKSALGKQNIG